LNSDLGLIEKSFEAKFVEPDRYQPKEEINGFAHLPYPVITDEDATHIVMAQWGLVPFWAKDDSIKRATLNAKIETLDKKPSYRNSTDKRCLVLADGFYEWQWLDPKGKGKQKYLIGPEEQDVFALAGIYSYWKNPETGNEVQSFSIVTTEANELMAEIHNSKKRMPVILRTKDRKEWLSGADYHDFAFPYEVKLVAQPC
jgi:putative SOS response-associated peptidase YedK